MATDVKVPAAGESITEVFIGTWLKKEGDTVRKDEALVEVETDKATLEVPAPVDGVVTELLKKQGDSAAIGEVIARIDAEAASGKEAEEAPEGEATSTGEGTKAKSDAAVGAEAAAIGKKAEAAKPEDAKTTGAEAEPTGGGAADSGAAGSGAAGSGTAESGAAEARAAAGEAKAPGGEPSGEEPTAVMPAARRLLDEHGLSGDEVGATGPGGRLLKEDVQRYLAERERAAAEPEKDAAGAQAPVPGGYERQEEAVPMSLLRRRIAERLVEAQQNAALLTTFNEVDMSAVLALRSEYKGAFEKRYGIRLGFMSFFVKAAVDALKLIPQLNAEIRETDIVYKNYYDIGVAVSTPKGLVVPVVRNAERLSFAEVEQVIADFGTRASQNKLTPDELQGGTFTISNGGVFGSLLSTPIVNPPQSGVLGMHTIQERPVALDGQVVIRPMMYLALTYDHRVVDGREAVTFLKRIKDAVENPARMLIEV
ncbi:MAG: 2-oxoglutarate dehydrogenase complex dihydrolipoyllysine-residue succinyltransferase [Trueperaceae bacterium]